MYILGAYVCAVHQRRRLRPQIKLNTIININIVNMVYWGYIGIMENKMETTIVGLYRDYYINIFSGMVSTVAF